MPANLPPSPMQSHSNELEHRITIVETLQQERMTANEAVKQELSDRLSSMDRRINLHEKAILGIGALLQVLMQDKYPALADLLKGLMK